MIHLGLPSRFCATTEASSEADSLGRAGKWILRVRARQEIPDLAVSQSIVQPANTAATDCSAE